MTQKRIKYTCGAVIAGSGLLANHAAGSHWPLWSITLSGAVFLAAVVTYLLAAQSGPGG